MAGKNDLRIEDAKIMFRNFAGREDKFNRAGDRNFAVKIPNDVVDQLKDFGWNIKMIAPHDDFEEPLYYLPVSVSYRNIPPKIVLVTSKKNTPLDEDMIEIIDTMELKTVDLIISPYHWEVNGKKGVKAYLRTGYFVMEEDPFAYKYEREEYNALPPGEEESF